MFSKRQFLESIEWDTNACKHLYGKLPKNALAYRPSDDQRTILEVMQYLTTCVRTPTLALIRNDFSHRDEHMEAIKSITAENFCGAMDAQLHDVKEMLEPISEVDLNARETKLRNGQPMILGEALVNFPLKFLAAYKLQFYTYLKAAGASALSTPNVWFGKDPH